MQFAPGQHWLEQVAGIHGAFCLARADDGMQFIDKENDLPFAFFDLVEHGLEAFLKFAAVLGAGNQRAHVEGKDFAIL